MELFILAIHVMCQHNLVTIEAQAASFDANHKIFTNFAISGEIFFYINV